jgi:hypothetical protein
VLDKLLHRLAPGTTQQPLHQTSKNDMHIFIEVATKPTAGGDEAT